MLPNLTLLRSVCTVGNSWDELSDDMRRLVLNKNKSRPMSVTTISTNPWLITVKLVEEGAAPPLTGRWELTYDGYERLGTNERGFQTRYREEHGFSWLYFSVPDASQAADRLKLLLREPEFSIRVNQRRSLVRHKSTFKEWSLNVPLSGSPRDTNLMAKLIGTIAPIAFDRLFQEVRRLYVTYKQSSYQSYTGESHALLRQRILENLDKFSKTVRAHQDGSFVEPPKETDPFDDMMHKWIRDSELHDSDKASTPQASPREKPRATPRATPRTPRRKFVDWKY